MTKHWPPPMKDQVLEELRKRDGGRCWLCDRPMDFKVEQPSPKAPTFEHLIPQCRGGPSTIDNLVLCHQPCNLELGDRSPAEEGQDARRAARRGLESWNAETNCGVADPLVPIAKRQLDSRLRGNAVRVR